MNHFTRYHLVHRFTVCLGVIVFAMSVPAATHAQTPDTLYSERSLFVAGDAALAAGFTLAALAASPEDRRFTRQLQDPARQANRFLNRGATVFRLFGHPGGMITGAGIYGIGLATGNRRTEDLGLHTLESVLLSNTITTVIKVTAGRARPRESPGNAASFHLMGGLKDDEHRSFPSGHASAAFAFASIISAETSHWWPETRWIVGPIVYGGATLTGVSRIYNNAHWASDVIAGAAVGTFTGIKVFRHQHSHPDNRLDKLFLRAGVQVSNNGSVMPILSMVPR
ncbi:MAG TPA: phosphatase PAP2 family protein [Gemmatimonadaceae bacterium]|nr:phosphatase PAP2 family protein [Gemmatimonadaceae bacterium]